MKKRVVPFDTLETFLETLQILFLNSPNKPNFEGLKQIFWNDSFEIDFEEQNGESEAQHE